VLTVPNVLSFLRLLMVPLFVWLALVPEADGWAVIVLVVSGITDWLDGQIARRWNQMSRVGELLDPVADRLFVVCAIAVLGIREIVPWWLVATLISRDAFMLLIQAGLRARGWQPLPVHYVGKAATACLLYALPMLLLTDGSGTAADVLRPVAWAFTWWGVGLYWWSAVLYAEQASALVAGRRAETVA
jgi:cardiolipin synthase